MKNPPAYLSFGGGVALFKLGYRQDRPAQLWAIGRGLNQYCFHFIHFQINSFMSCVAGVIKQMKAKPN
jgi:hypothetical protein